MSYDTPEDILRLARDFMGSRILLSGAELNIFSLLSRAPLTAEEISLTINTDVRATIILLDALAAMGFLMKNKGSYRCTPSLLPLLSDEHPHSVLPMILHAAHLWRRWSRLTDVVRGEHESGEAPGFAPCSSEMRAFIGAMHVVSSPRAQEIVTAVNPGSAKTMLDVGGASGTYTTAFLQASPGMKATLFDRPEVIEMARERLREAGVLDRVSLTGGDFYRDEFPQGHDLAFVSAIIHQNSPKQNLELYRRIFRSLNRGGRIVIRDYVMEPDKVQPKGGAIFAVNMLVGTEGGGTYTFDEIKTGLQEAGFIHIRLLKKGEIMDALMEAFKP